MTVKRSMSLVGRCVIPCSRIAPEPGGRSPHLRGPRVRMRLAGAASLVQSEPSVPPTQCLEAVFPCGCDRQVKAQCWPHVAEDVAVEVASLVFHAALTDDALVDRRSFAVVIKAKGTIPRCPAQAHGEMHDARGWTREFIKRCGNTKGFRVAVRDTSTHTDPLPGL